MRLTREWNGTLHVVHVEEDSLPVADTLGDTLDTFATGKDRLGESRTVRCPLRSETPLTTHLLPLGVKAALRLNVRQSWKKTKGSIADNLAAAHHEALQIMLEDSCEVE